MQNLEYILSLAGTAFSLLAASITFMFKFIVALKAKKESLTREKINDALPSLIEEAEKFIHYSGTEKKEYVLTKINQFAIENNLKFNIQFVSDKIEELVELSKQVNKRAA